MRTLSQSIGFSSSINNIFSYFRSIFQSIIFNLNAFGRFGGYNEAIVQLQITIGNSANRLVSIFRTIFDAFSLDNIASRFGIFSRTSITGFSIGDVVNRLRTVSVSLSQALSLNNIASMHTTRRHLVILKWNGIMPMGNILHILLMI